MDTDGLSGTLVRFSWDDSAVTRAGLTEFALPTGTVAFLLTDVEGSTRLWEAEAEQMGRAMERHRSILDAAVSAHGGVCPPAQGEGDSIVAAFARPSDAVLAARDAQRDLVAEPWPTSRPLRVRMAVHAGEARFADDGNYSGQAIIRTARLRAIAHGGQVLVSAAARDLTIDHLGDGVQLLDLGEHRLRDLARPERVYQLVGPGLLDEFPALLSLDAHPNNLPVQLSSFIGRMAEIDDVTRLVCGNRLVTVTGSGGAGKTRLAQRVAAEALPGFADGAWWVELADVRDPAILAATVASAIGVQADVGEHAADELAGRLAGRQLLLVLDNCEHLIDPVARLVDRLLRGAATVSVLATSREPLAVDGEVTWRIPPLSVPAPSGDAGRVVSALSQYDSVSLFLDRARGARSNFRLDDENAADVAEICQRLDGIPLAIELAAARCRSLTPAQIHAGLADMFRMLAGTGRVVLPRHQTLEASIRWSHELLAPTEQALLRRLAVFNGGCTLDDAESVVVDELLAQPDVLDLLDRLVTQSLVLLDDSTRVPRYRLLETVRAYSADRLQHAGEADALRIRHAEHFLALAIETGPKLSGRDDLDTFGRLAPELDNFRGALDTLAALDRADECATILTATDVLWEILAPGEGSQRLTHLLEQERHSDPELRARVLYSRSYIAAYLGDVQGAVTDADAALKSTEDPALRGRARAKLATAIAMFNTVAADPMFEEAIAECVAGNDLLGEADTRSRRAAMWSCFRADMVRAAVYVAEAQPLAVRFGGCYLRAYDDATQAIACTIRGEFTEAFVRCEQSERGIAALASAAGIEPAALLDSSLVGTCVNFARTWARLALDGPETVPSMAKEVEVARRRGDITAECLRGLNESMRLYGMGETEAALAESERLAETSASIGNLTFEANFLWFAAHCARRLGWNDRAESFLGRIDALPPETRAMYLFARMPVTRAYLALASGELGLAADLTHEGLLVAHEHRMIEEVARALTVLASIEAANLAWTSCTRFGAAARRIWRDMGAVCSMDDSFAELDRSMDAAREALGPEAFEQALAEGESMDVDAAVEYARRTRGERRRPSFGWAALTPTEQLIVDEVAKGATNPAIAETLFVSRETVKTHLSHIFAKLGVKSRSELAAAAAERRATSEIAATKA
jgi:predicted ATPase/class 3 adenylate cyclase/DNA-binding CsgD family transcriptional regulator